MNSRALDTGIYSIARRSKMEEVVPEKLKDFRRNPSYERRAVVFYDFLGWRSHINAAGDDAKKLGQLRRLILRNVRSLSWRSTQGFRASTFSDNIVISAPLGGETQMLLQTVALYQLGAATQGFLIRGGMTIGNIVHDSECVFGPGLNRAYQLESEIAHYPRIVIDQEVKNEFGNLGDLAVVEEGQSFVDPFTVKFIRFLSELERLPSELVTVAGLPVSVNGLKHYRPDQVLSVILDSLKAQIRSPLGDKEYQKVAWLFDRIARRLGVPLARSYPRPLLTAT